MSGVKAPVQINLPFCQALWTQRKNVECTKDASDRALQLIVDVIEEEVMCA